MPASRNETLMRRTQDWLRQAEGEFKAATDLHDTQNFAWACFLCHQAAEKALKAAFEHFRNPRFGHNLMELVDGLRTFTMVPNVLEDVCRRLNRFYIPPRYPDAFPSGASVDMYTVADSTAALDDARRVLEFVRSLVLSP